MNTYDLKLQWVKNTFELFHSKIQWFVLNKIHINFKSSMFLN